MFKVKGAQPGFSLTEIIIAVAIVGMIAAGSLGFVSYLSKARRSATKTRLSLYKNMVEQYRQDTGKLPATLEDLRQRPADAEAAKRWDGPYLEDEVPTTDVWNGEIQYVVHNPRGGKDAYELYSFGPDGEGASDSKWIRA